jgi:hypothetical protein
MKRKTLIPLFITFSLLLPNVMGSTNTLSKAKLVIATLKTELVSAQAELVDTQSALDLSALTVDATQSRVATLENDIKVFGVRFDKALEYGDGQKARADKLEVKYTQLSNKTNLLSLAIGALFALVAFLFITKYMGSMLIFAGPFSFWAYAVACSSAGALGVGLVQSWFRSK